MSASISEHTPSSTGHDHDKDGDIVADHEAHATNADDASSEHKQEGVKRVEAITTVFDKKLLICMFILLYLVAFVDALGQSVGDNLAPYVTSSFGEHGLLTIVSLVARIIGGVVGLSIAKIIDIWGRCEGFIVMVAINIIGSILKAVSRNVETYAAGYTFSWVGHIGMNYVITVMLADMTTLRNRLILYGIQNTPGIVTVFAGSRIADLFYHRTNFRWAFSAFAIILAAFAAPVCVVLVYSSRKAVRQGLIQPRHSNRTVWQSIKHYAIEFDVVGMFLTIFGFVLLLLPFSIVSYAPHSWRTPYIIALIVLGAALLAAFVVWERFFASVQYFPFKYLKDRTILGACGAYGIMFLSIFCWDAYYGSYLQVVHGLSITTSNYVLNGLSLASNFIGPFVGLFVSRTGWVKWTAIGGIPFVVLGTVLLVEYRTPTTPVGALVAFQILNGIGDGIWTPVSRLAVMATVPHQQIAVGLALFALFGSIGSAIGNAIAGGIWNNILPQKIEEFLPEKSKNQSAKIFGSIAVQLTYPLGSPERDAIIAAYAYVQRRLVIAGSAFLPLAIVCIFVWKNVNVRKLEALHGTQAKGTIF